MREEYRVESISLDTRPYPAIDTLTVRVYFALGRLTSDEQIRGPFPNIADLQGHLVSPAHFKSSFYSSFPLGGCSLMAIRCGPTLI